MKKILLLIIISAFFTTYAVKTNAQYAKKDLSNLTAPTAINVNLLPDKDKSRNLGNINIAWKNLYLDSAVYISGHRFLSGRIGAFIDNTAVGQDALISNTGSQNTAVGYNAMYLNTSGYQNTAVGLGALYSNTSGYYNTAVGLNALYSNATGSHNTSTGLQSLKANTSGAYNTAYGMQALYSNTTAYYNTAIGAFALYFNTGSSNTAVGYNALSNNTSGYSNTSIGYLAGWKTTTGNDNLFIGDSAGLQNTTGFSNTASGYSALVTNTSGNDNTAYGAKALYSNTTASENTAYGIDALYGTTTGYNNTAIGGDAGTNVKDGSYNTFIGHSANCGTGGHLVGSTAIGNDATVTASNHVVIGNSSVTTIGGYANWTNISDGRVKKNIKQNVPGLEFINKLRPITYNLDLDAADKIIARPVIKDKDGKTIQPSAEELKARTEKQQIVYTGFVAQDVEKAASDLSYDFSGVDKPSNANTLYGLRYSDFVVPLVKAVQELSAQNEALKNQNTDLEQRVSKLEAMMNVSNQSSLNSQQATVISSASLSQNIPNPFSGSTAINYSLPKQFSSARIIITDKNGSVLKTITLSNKGPVNVDASTMTAGAYQYALYVDGKLISSKQMILAK